MKIRKGQKLMTDSRDLYLLSKYDRYDNTEFKIFDLLGSIAQARPDSVYNAVDAIDIEALRFQVDEFLEYCIVLKRYRKLDMQFNGTLKFVQPERHQKQSVNSSSPTEPKEDHFEIGEHIFHTLDEVEKAWANRAFL